MEIDGTAISKLFDIEVNGTKVDWSDTTDISGQGIKLIAKDTGTLTEAQKEDLEALNDKATTVKFNITADAAGNLNFQNAVDLGGATVDGQYLADLFTATLVNQEYPDGKPIDLTNDAADPFEDGDEIILTAIDRGDMTSEQYTALEGLFGAASLTKGTNGADTTNTTVTVTDGTMTDNAEYQKLQAMSNEKNFVDIGIGMEEDENGKLIESSAFNDNLQGINFLGYGVDEDGDPKNIAVIIKQMSQCLERCDENGAWTGDDGETFNRLLGKLEDASSELKSNYAQLDAKASFLETQSDQLEKSADILNEQFLEIEQCDLADAITSYSWAQYCYNAALKVGNSILSQSLIDYLD
jgi:flagellin-like hook-associated protein FlgL